jgi:hypothetical protein
MVLKCPTWKCPKCKGENACTDRHCDACGRGQDNLSWSDMWPSRDQVPRIWKDDRTPDPRRDYTFTRFDGKVLSHIDEFGEWRWPWWYRIPGRCACYTDTFEAAQDRVRKYWFEVWLKQTFPNAEHLGFSAVTYPWLDDVKFTDYKPPGVYC